MRNTSILAGTSLILAIPFLSCLADSNERLAQRILAVYPAADADGDGSLSKSELAAVARAAIEKYPQADTDGNGKLSATEQERLVAHLERRGEPDSSDSASSSQTESNAAIRQGPRPIKPGEARVGRQIPDLQFTDISGAQHHLSEFKAKKAIVIALTGNGCPLCLKYAPTLAELERTYRDQDVAFVFINPNESETTAELRQAVAKYGFEGPYIQDSHKLFPSALAASTTTEVFVLDSAQTLVYRGAVDDQYGFGYSLAKPRKSYLVDALNAVLKGRKPTVQATSSPGCELFYDRVNNQPTPLTYHNQISRIIQSNCIECHRDGGIAPIGLESYEEVKDYAGMIRNVVRRGVMPPWFASPQGKSEKGQEVLHWANDRSLPESDKADLYSWIEAGAPEGDPADAPLPKKFPEGWLIGKPDAVFEFPKPVAIKASGIMPYKYVTVETNLPEDKWVQAIEVRPGKIDVVHHVIVSVRGGDEEVDERDGYWGAYVPGNSTLIYPEGFARRLPKNAKLRFQMHYTPNGTATTDSTRIGLVFSEEPPRHEVKVAGIANPRINIPPRDSHHKEFAEIELPHDIELLSFLPHMHLRGKAARYDLISEGSEQVLLDIPEYDFNWQLLYRLAEPRLLRRGETIRFTGWFDNSSENPANPNPNTTVKWGQQTEDEMLLGYVEYIVPDLDPGERGANLQNRDRGETGNVRLGRQRVNPKEILAAIRRLDRNRDGKLTKEEVPQRHIKIFQALDASGDDIVTIEEAEAVLSKSRR